MNETTQKFPSVRDLEVICTSGRRMVHTANGISFDMDKGKTLALVGRTGAGKATITKATLGVLLDPPARLKQGRITPEGEDLLEEPAEEMLKIHGGKIAMIFQDPMTALNPIMTVGKQIMERLLLHNDYTRREAEKEAGKILEPMGIPAERFAEYPLEFSSGMKQRVVIAMALACSPDLLLADEPATALNVIIQAQVLDLIEDLEVKYNTSALLTTHNLSVVVETSDQVAVVYTGEILEYDSREDIFLHPSHPYTVGPFHSLPGMNSRARQLKPITGSPSDPTNLPEGCAFVPRCPHVKGGCSKEKIEFREIASGHFCRCDLEREGDQYMLSLVEVKHLKKYFRVPAGVNHAMDDVSLSIEKGETLGVVGESRCEKPTLGRTPVRLQEATGGGILLNGTDVTHIRGEELRAVQEQMRIVFQGSYSSLNPRMRIESTIMEPLRRSGRFRSRSELQDEASRLVDLAGVDERPRRSCPRELDEGRRQRVGIARALALDPEFIVCGEPASALNVSAQAQVLSLLMDLQEKSGAAYIFVTHDLSVVRHISDNICVMYLEQLVKKTPGAELFAHTLHPYTKALLSAILSTDILHPMKRLPLKGEITSSISPKPSCRFYSKYPYTAEACRQPQEPTEISGRHFVSYCRVPEISG